MYSTLLNQQLAYAPTSSHRQPILSVALTISLGLTGLVKSASILLLTSKILLSDVGDLLSVEMPQTGRVYISSTGNGVVPAWVHKFK